jgi:hypothetical protein
MFSFFKNVIKARDEWLKTPRPIPKRAIYLNALAKEKAQAQAEAEAEAQSKVSQASISISK